MLLGGLEGAIRVKDPVSAGCGDYQPTQDISALRLYVLQRPGCPELTVRTSSPGGVASAQVALSSRLSGPSSSVSRAAGLHHWPVSLSPVSSSVSWPQVALTQPGLLGGSGRQSLGTSLVTTRS